MILKKELRDRGARWIRQWNHILEAKTRFLWRQADANGSKSPNLQSAQNAIQNSADFSVEPRMKCWVGKDTGSQLVVVCVGKYPGGQSQQ